jgi:hypothetical protein
MTRIVPIASVNVSPRRSHTKAWSAACRIAHVP